MTTQQITNVVSKKPVKLPAALTGKMNVSSEFSPPDVDSMRIIVTGRPGCGKSSFVASNPRVLLFDLEKGAGTVIDPQCTRAELRLESKSAADDIMSAVDGFISAYKTDAALRESIKSIAFDSFDRLVELFLRDLCLKHGLEDAGEYKGGHGRGYFKVRDEIFGMLERIQRAGLGWILISHLTPKEVEGRTLATLAVSKSFRDNLVRSRDMMFRMECTQRKVKQKTKSGLEIEVASKNPNDRQYVLLTDTSSSADDFDSPKSCLPIESGLVIPAVGGWQTFRDAYAKAVERRRGEAVRKNS